MLARLALNSLSGIIITGASEKPSYIVKTDLYVFHSPIAYKPVYSNVYKIAFLLWFYLGIIPAETEKTVVPEWA